MPNMRAVYRLRPYRAGGARDGWSTPMAERSSAPARDVLRAAFDAAVAAADPVRATAAALRGAQHAGRPYRRVLVLGAGKAAAAMAQGVELAFAAGTDRVVGADNGAVAGGGAGGPPPELQGLVITRYGHALPTHHVRVVEAAHPVPDEAGASATERLLELARSAGEDDLVVALISGGGSSLLSAPEGLTPEALAGLTKQLLRSGASIAEMNAVRKHLSRVAGGALALAAWPAKVMTLVISDVVGDDPSTVASGPTVADPTTFQDALDVLQRYAIDEPDAVAALERGARGERPETAKPGDAKLAGNTVEVIASNQASLEAAARSLSAQGYAPHVLSSRFEGEARALARFQAAMVRQVLEHQQPFGGRCALVSGGETTVTVRGDGRGGRNTEFGLALALALEPGTPVSFLAADSDGIDGSEDNAGVLVDAPLLERLDREAGEAALRRNDAHGFFSRQGDGLLITGPTHTNVNDVRIVLIHGPDA